MTAGRKGFSVAGAFACRKGLLWSATGDSRLAVSCCRKGFSVAEDVGAFACRKGLLCSATGDSRWTVGCCRKGFSVVEETGRRNELSEPVAIILRSDVLLVIEELKRTDTSDDTAWYLY